MKRFLRQAKILYGVSQANVLDHLANEFLVIRKHACFHLGSEQIAQDSPEIFMAREGHERARVRDHPDKIGQKAAVRQCVDLPLNPFFLGSGL